MELSPNLFYSKILNGISGLFSRFTSKIVLWIKYEKARNNYWLTMLEILNVSLSMTVYPQLLQGEASLLH